MSEAIIDGNALVAKTFFNAFGPLYWLPDFKEKDGNDQFKESELKFHNDGEWLLTAFSKVENSQYYHSTLLRRKSCCIKAIDGTTVEMHDKSTKKAMYAAIVAFAKLIEQRRSWGN